MGTFLTSYKGTFSQSRDRGKSSTEAAKDCPDDHIEAGIALKMSGNSLRIRLA